MSRGVTTDNPIVLFGNIGPDVVKVSQIYDPDNDQYTPSEDVVVQDKTYYIRTYSNRVIEFHEVSHPSATDNPKENGWYEVNAEHVDQTGKYVPAAKSLVVCDVAYQNFQERAILIVDSVDDQGDNPTFKSTLVPSTNGQDPEVSTRIVDYGNDRFMLYMEQDGEFVRLCPDRKLMLYGNRLYAYSLVRDGRSISVPAKELVGVTNDALVPYSGETTSEFVLDSTTIGANQGKLFAMLVGTNYRAVTIPDPTSENVCCKTLDETYLLGKNYYLEEYAPNGAITYRKLTPGTDYDVGMLVGDLKGQDDVGYKRIYVQGNQFLFGVTQYVGYLTKVDRPEGAIRYPERCYLKSGLSLSSGEIITMEVFEFEGDSYRMVLSLKLIARTGTTLEASTKITKQLDSFKIAVENAEADELGRFKLPVGESTKNWVFHPTLVFNDGTEEIVPLDGVQSFIYGLENINSANVGQEFRLLFKYFPTKESPIHENMTKNYVSTTVTVIVTEGSSVSFRKVSTIPLWKYDTGGYTFAFLPYNKDFTEPEIIYEGGRVGDNKALAFNLASYMDPNGNIRTLDPERIGENDGVYQHARLALTAKMSGYSTDVYRQNVAMRLQPWTENSIATKWLIGSYLQAGTTIEEYSADEVPYGSTTVGKRPFIECSKLSAGYALRVPYRTFGTKEEFMLNFFTKGYKEPSELDSATSQLPDNFRIRSLATVDVYDKLDSETALEGINYYKSNGTLVPVVVGKTPVNKYYIRFQIEFKYFRLNDDNEWEQIVGYNIGDTLTLTQRETLYIQRVRPVVSEWREIPATFNSDNGKFILKIGDEPIDGSKFYLTNMLGGPFPTVVGEPRYGTQVMGIIIVEFALYDTTTDTYRWLYGVPVEVKFPYTPTSDTNYQHGKTYYVYDPQNNTFSADSGTAGAEIPVEPQRYESIYS